MNSFYNFGSILIFCDPLWWTQRRSAAAATQNTHTCAAKSVFIWTPVSTVSCFHHVFCSLTCCLSNHSTLAAPLCPCLLTVYKRSPYKVAVHASVTKWLAATSDSSSFFLCVCERVRECGWELLAFSLLLPLSLPPFICLPTFQHPLPNKKENEKNKTLKLEQRRRVTCAHQPYIDYITFKR